MKFDQSFPMQHDKHIYGSTGTKEFDADAPENPSVFCFHSLTNGSRLPFYLRTTAGTSRLLTSITILVTCYIDLPVPPFPHSGLWLSRTLFPELSAASSCALRISSEPAPPLPF